MEDKEQEVLDDTLDQYLAGMTKDDWKEAHSTSFAAWLELVDTLTVIEALMNDGNFFAALRLVKLATTADKEQLTECHCGKEGTGAKFSDGSCTHAKYTV